MNEDKDDTQANNSHYAKKCGEAVVRLVGLLRALGRESAVEHYAVVTRAKDLPTGCVAEARVTIVPRGSRYTRTYTRIQVQVERTRHPITFNRSHAEWQDFPWDKIVQYHLAELDSRLAGNVSVLKNRKAQEDLADLAQQEVPLPIAPGPYGDPAPTLMGFSRQRNEDGTYCLRITASGFTAAEARAGRPDDLLKEHASAGSNFERLAVARKLIQHMLNRANPLTMES
jgi:hypothetical protein